MKGYLLNALALALPAAAAAQTTAPDTGHWEVMNQTSPLTGARTVAASIASTNQLANMLGYAERASLVIRCGEGGLAVYVNWPQVVSRDGENVWGSPKTMASWRIDEGKIKVNFWDISSTGTAAGEFKQKNAAKLLASLFGARRLAVRLTGQQTQDAAFDLSGIDKIARDTALACGLNVD
jgi:hypothetical protein